jgi:hypothetical protein
VYLSALGGYGTQRAMFANRKTAIASSTRQGRVDTVTIERVGRLAVFWNHCKHVIVYERTVLPSAQFVTEQEAEEGRPIVRKVEEYIQVVQAVRRFPEDPSNPAARGCVEAIVCRTSKIAVESAWGRDVPGGWIVPLWNPAKADENTDGELTYPKPQFELQMAGDPAAKSGLNLVPIASPERIIFYTSVRSQDTDDTDSWPPAPGVDWPLVPVEPQLPPSTIPSIRRGDLDGMLPPERAEVPGWAAVTFQLDRSAGFAANVVAARADNPISATLSNVTLMRPQPPGWNSIATTQLQTMMTNGKPGADPSSLTFETTRAYSDDLREQIGLVRDVLARLPWDPHVLDNPLVPPSDRSAFVAAAQDFINAAASKPRNSSQEIKQLLHDKNNLFKEQFITDLATLAQQSSGSPGYNANAKALGQRIAQFVAYIGTPFSGLANVLPSEGVLRQVTGPFRAELTRLQHEADILSGDTGVLWLSTIAASLTQQRENLLQQFDTGAAGLLQPTYETLPGVRNSIMDGVSQTRHHLDDALSGLDRQATTLTEAVDRSNPSSVRAAMLGVSDEIGSALAALDDVDQSWEQVIAKVAEIAGSLKPVLAAIANSREVSLVRDLATDLQTDPSATGVAAAIAEVIGLKEWFPPIDKGSAAALETISGFLRQPETSIPALRAVQDAIPNIPIDASAETISGLIAEARTKLDAFAQAGNTLELVMAEQIVVPSVAAKVQSEATGLQMVRACGDAPIVPGLGFNRTQIAYLFSRTDLFVVTTPMTALYDRAGDALKGIGLRVPTSTIASRLVPNLDNFNISNLFPDIAGIKLDKLFPDVAIPSGASDKVNVRHGVDVQTQRAWIDAEVVPISIDGSVPLFDFSGFSMRITEGTFRARARLAVGESGTVERQSSGQVDGDWAVAFGGSTLITFQQTPLSFDQSNKVRFGIRPDRVKLAPELDFINSFLTAAGPLMGTDTDGGGLFTIGALLDGSVPSGVECLLTLPVPDLTEGTFGISGLVFVTGVQLRVLPEFSVTVHAALGAPSSPFTITIFILGGSGWVQCWGRYAPLSGLMSCHVSVAIGVSATLAFNFGPISGIVQLLIAFNAALDTKPGQSAIVAISQIMIVRGQVDVAGLITAALMVMLEMRITDGTVIGLGTAYFSIRLGPFFRFQVSQSVAYNLTTGKSSSRTVHTGDPAGDHASALV